MGDKEETSVNSCGPRNPVCETSVGDKCKLIQPKWGDKCKLMRPLIGRQVWETSVGDKCKLMRPKAPRVRDKCGRQGGDKGETSVNSCGP